MCPPTQVKPFKCGQVAVHLLGGSVHEQEGQFSLTIKATISGLDLPW